MKRIIRLWFTLVLVLVFLVGCGSNEVAENVDDNTNTETETDTENEGTEQEPEETTDFSISLPLPRYSYSGTEKYMSEISDYLLDNYGNELGLSDADALIPFGIIAQADEDNSEDIVVYGSFNVSAFTLRNTTLCSTAGAYSYGEFHLSQADNGYTITSGQLTETYYDMEDLFSPVEGLLDKINAITQDDIKAAEEEALAGYVNSNGLSITQWQEYGSAPKAILNAPDTPEDLQIYTFESPLGYEITYDLRKFTLSTIQDFGDMFGIVEDSSNYSGTFMTINTSSETDLEKAVYDMASDTGAKDLEFSDTIVGANYSAKTAQWTEKLDDGREFRYIFYGVETDNGVFTIKLSTTYDKDLSDIGFDELGIIFADTLTTFR